MRVLPCLGLMVAMSCGVSAADEKIDAKKLVGKWEQSGESKVKALVEYTADGKMRGSVTFGENERKFEGTYKVEGNKMMQTIKSGENEIMRTVTLTKLTDDAMEVESDKGLKVSYKRVKAEKKPEK